MENFYQFLKAVNFAIALLVMSGLVLFALNCRKKLSKEHDKGNAHTSFLESLWASVPIVIFVLVFVWGWS